MGRRIGVQGEWSQNFINSIQWLPYYPQCLEPGARGQSGQRAPSPAGAKQEPAPGPVSALLPSTGEPHALRRQGKQECSTKRRSALTPLPAQVWCSHEARASVPEAPNICPDPDGLGPPGFPKTDGSVSLVQWMEPGALGDHGLPAMCAWGSPTGAGCAAILPPLTEAGLVLGATSRAAPVGTVLPCAQVNWAGIRV